MDRLIAKTPNWKPLKEMPHQVAEIWEDGKIVGYAGGSHRGHIIPRMGHRVFDINYAPVKEDYPPELWEEFEKKYNDRMAKYEAEGDELEIQWLKESGIASVIGFKYRGKKIAETLEDLKQSAINFAEYIS